MSLRVGLTRPSQLLKSPTTLTLCAFGAQTAKYTPAHATCAHARQTYRKFSSVAFDEEMQIDLAMIVRTDMDPA